MLASFLLGPCDIEGWRKKPYYLQIALPVPLPQCFDYLPNEEQDESAWWRGLRVKVPFGRRVLVGILVQVHTTPSCAPDKLKPIIDVLDTVPCIPPSLLSLCQWVSQYYHYPLGLVVSASLPTLLRRGRTIDAEASKPALQHEAECSSASAALTLNEEQAAALDRILNAQGFEVFLLDGVTGSGKTEIYMQAAQHVLDQGKQVLILVPEINLTPQTVKRFEARFQIVPEVLHSKVSDKKQCTAWLNASRGDVPLVIGTRSAVMTPLPKLGLIVVDEEHDPAHLYKCR